MPCKVQVLPFVASLLEGRRFAQDDKGPKSRLSLRAAVT